MKLKASKEKPSSKPLLVRQVSNRTVDFLDMLDILDVERESFQEAFGVDAESFSMFAEGVPVSFWVHDEGHNVVYGNQHFLKNFGNCLRQHCFSSLMGKERVCECCRSKNAFEKFVPERCKYCKRYNAGCDINTCHWPMKNRKNDKLILKTAFHIDEQSNFFKDILSVEETSGSSDFPFITCCSSCKKVKDRFGRWIFVENTVLGLFSNRISHGICKRCVGVLYPNLHIPENCVDD